MEIFYKMEEPGFESRQDNWFSILKNVHTGSGAHTAFRSMGTAILSLLDLSPMNVSR
jgi:hypothetical protein